MTAHAFTLEPVDLWFFRDGRPYNEGEASQTAVPSLFPPHPATVLGALRAALARANGWSQGQSWSAQPELCRVLGDGPEDLGSLRFRGPYLARRADDMPRELLFPLPAHVRGERTSERTWRPVDVLTPGESVMSDLGRIRLPVPARSGDEATSLAALPGAWLTCRGLAEILAGKPPRAADLIEPAALWRRELRVGIVRDADTRSTAKIKRAPYSPLMIRMQRDVALVAALDGVPAAWLDRLPAYVPLGGESRLAACAPWSGSLAAPSCPSDAIRASRRVAVIHLSPARLAALPGPGDALPDLPGTRVVSACLPPPVKIGGWDGRVGQPVPLSPCVAAGSVWFCELTGTDEDVARTLAQHDSSIGGAKAHGFGHIALAAWPERIDPARSMK